MRRVASTSYLCPLTKPRSCEIEMPLSWTIFWSGLTSTSLKFTCSRFFDVVIDDVDLVGAGGLLQEDRHVQRPAPVTLDGRLGLFLDGGDHLGVAGEAAAELGVADEDAPLEGAPGVGGGDARQDQQRRGQTECGQAGQTERERTRHGPIILPALGHGKPRRRMAS